MFKTCLRLSNVGNPFAGHAPNPAGDPPLSVFRATHIEPDHPALAGRVLVPR